MLDLGTILISLISAFSILLVAYVAGLLLQKVVNKLRGNEVAIHPFWRIFSGLFLLVSLYAIVSTKGVTILLPIPLLLFLFTWHMTGAGNNITEPARKTFGFLPLALLFNFTFFCIGFTSFQPGMMDYLSGDFNIYFRVVNRLNALGIENYILDPTYGKSFSPAPYHYGDLWLFAIVARVVSTNPTIIFLSTVSLLATLAVFGVHTYVSEKFREYLQNKNGVLYLLLLCGLFSGFAVFFPTFLLKPDIYVYSILNYPKVMLPTSILMGMLLLVQKKNWIAFTLFGMTGALLFINVMPNIYMTMFILFLVSIVRREIAFKKALVLTLCYTLFTAAFVYILYKVLPGTKPVNASPVTNEPGVFLTGSYFKTAINIFIGGIFQLFTILPYLLILAAGLFIKYKKEAWKKIIYPDTDIVFLVLLIFSGLVCWAVLYPTTADTVQFFHNVLYPVYVAIISLLVVWTIKIVRNKVLIVLLLLCITTAAWKNREYEFSLESMNKQEWTNMQAFFKDDTVPPGFIYLRSNLYFNTIFKRNTLGFVPLNILCYKWPGYSNISLNAPFLTLDSTSAYYGFEKQVQRNAPFTKYMTSKGINDIETATTSFIKDYNIKYIAVAADTILPGYLRPHITDSLNLPVAGWSIYRLGTL